MIFSGRRPEKLLKLLYEDGGGMGEKIEGVVRASCTVGAILEKFEKNNPDDFSKIGSVEIGMDGEKI